jgi:hypothetical protein
MSGISINEKETKEGNQGRKPRFPSTFLLIWGFAPLFLLIWGCALLFLLI